MNETRYKLLSDDDGHHYAVPLDQEQAFENWLESVYDPMCDDLPMPDGIESLGGSPEQVTFTNPKW